MIHAGHITEAMQLLQPYLPPNPSGEDGAETEVVYNLDVDLLVRLPGFVKRRAESKIVHAAVDDLKERLEI